MASQLGACVGTSSRSVHIPVLELRHRFVLVPQEQPARIGITKLSRISRGTLRAKVSDDDTGSYDLWKKARDRKRKDLDFKRIIENTVSAKNGGDKESAEELKKRTQEFQKILEVPGEERDRIQRMQAIDRPGSAIAARAALQESNNGPKLESKSGGELKKESSEDMEKRQEGKPQSESETSNEGIPGPDFWSWTPPLDSGVPPDGVSGLQTAIKPSVNPSPPDPVVEKEQSLNFLSIPLESNRSSPLPPFQSLLEAEKMKASKSNLEASSLEEEQKQAVQFTDNAAEAAHALNDVDKSLPSGMNPDGSRWWKETGIETRPDGVVCRWTMTRGVSADKATEWQEKFWEAADELGYKELGSEKSGRDAVGNVWREFWKESIGQENGMHIEKTADKWGKNGKGDQWQEKWLEHYNISGHTEKWAHKWCSIDPNTPLEAGHAHVWHERWGEKYDGLGSSMKYTDKWAERSHGDGWEKWGDKWDEKFDQKGHGVKQGETWWEGKSGERWNRTWGEQHNGSGWIHKYGKSSSGEHWDIDVLEDTWYEKFPHYGFFQCYENSVQLRQVQKPSEKQEP